MKYWKEKDEVTGVVFLLLQFILHPSALQLKICQFVSVVLKCQSSRKDENTATDTYAKFIAEPV